MCRERKGRVATVWPGKFRLVGLDFTSAACYLSTRPMSHVGAFGATMKTCEAIARLGQLGREIAIVKTNRRLVLARLGLLASMLLFLVAAQGCSHVSNYIRYRAEDALEMMDVGVTVSKKPQFGLYATFFSVVAAGYADVDGHFVGVGGGQAGLTRNRFKAWGLLAIGHETMGWGDFDENDPRTINEQYSGAVGVAFFPLLSRRAQYMPS